MNDLEFLRDIFKDPRLHIGIGTVQQLGLASDGSVLRVMINLLPDNREIVCEMTFADVYDVTFPEINDLVLVGHVDGDVDEAFVMKVISNKDEPIPALARTGDSVKYSRPGKKLYIGSDTKIGIARPGVDPSEPLVLGNQLVAVLQALAKAFTDNATQIGETNLMTGITTLDPGVVSAINSFVSSLSGIKSQIAFTESGG